MHHCSRHCDTLLSHEMLSYPSRSLKTREERNTEITSFRAAWYMRNGRGAQGLTEAGEEAHQSGRLLHGTNLCIGELKFEGQVRVTRLGEWIATRYSAPPRWHPMVQTSWIRAVLSAQQRKVCEL